MRFNSGLLGSRAITGALTRQEFMTMADASGNHSLEDAAAAYGVTWESLSAIRPVPICAYLEIHVEQGPILEERQIPLGIVNVIAGRSQGYVQFTGHQNHAGTTPMDKRQDALLAAAQAVVGLHEAVMDHECVGTVGDIIADPGSPNVIAGHSAISFDVRAPNDDIREAVLRRWQASWAAGAIVQRVDKAAVALDLTIRNILSDAAARLQIPTMFLNSWAVHDAMILAQSVPSGLLFIPSAAGVSHARDEWSSPQDCEIGVMVFEEAARTILTGT
ncbi:M20/M25/M40 family metallo-hydrolase [Sulfobacillus sp. hq2]|uniref:M20/M25/M40 family metallo-hydrolase n=1 Tax=Sulfobacillus TaxID=28033 RepID=UPI000CD30BA5|nr:M20/M25/M40 family metallo-hydrolase [Sulfobacillus sp. hq2]POB09580.1 hypothetical protein CO251_15330 [Sulfobacillus sp. hq2]